MITMKVAIISDMHLGYERFYDDAYKQAGEALSTASQIADVIIIPGDIFDFRYPKPDVLAQGLNLFRPLKDKNWEARITKYSGSGKIFTNVPVIAIPGTHERRAQDSENAVDLMNLAGFLANCSEATIEVSKLGEKIYISALGGVSEERVKDALKEINFTPTKDHFNIFMFHQSIYELLPFSDDFIHYEDLPKGFNLYVNGHIHSKFEAKVHDSPFLIPGSTVLTQLKDGEQGEKGFFVYDTISKKYEFHKIQSREFMVERINISGKSEEDIKKEITSRIKKDIASKSQKPIIRVILEGKANIESQNMTLAINEIIKKEANNAIVEISKSGIEDEKVNADIESIRSKSLENMSIKDFGLALFLDRLKNSNYNLSISASDLFDMLSSEPNKEKAIKKALDTIFNN